MDNIHASETLSQREKGPTPALDALESQRMSQITDPNTYRASNQPSIIEKMNQTGGLSGQQQQEALETIIQEATAETRQQEAQMKTQQERDDAELEILKQKLLNSKNLPMPSNKDEVIEYLQVRLESAEEAIATCEEIIEHERNNRNQMSSDLKERNATLKALIEKERNNISEKVNQELETTLAMALREKE